jgi:hypothetical protein
MKLLLNIFILLITFNLYSQEFTIEQQYKQAMTNAKTAFEAKQYSEAVMFYREALKIKPDALLPKYKIEDIRTIYIKKEMASVKPKTSEKQKKKSNKKQQKEDKVLAEKIKTEATKKMNNDADKIQQELKNIDVVDINDDTEINLDSEDISITDIESDKQTIVKKIDTKNSNLSVKSDKQTKNNVSVMQKRTVPEIKQTSVKESEKKKNEQPKHIDSSKKNQQTKQSSTTKKKWIEQENEKLAKKYPNKKTVEEIDKTGKHITRIIMNINNKVTIYLKVHHNWGATYYFIDEVGRELRSINQQYFNLMTNLETYGN